MHKFIVTISVVIISGFVLLNSCKKSPVTPPLTTEQKITGKWTLKSAIGSYTLQGNNRKDTAKFTAADYFNFKSDGTITIVETGATYNGNWRITNNKLYITNTHYIDYASGFTMPTLTGTDLQLYYTENNSISTLEQKLNLFK